MLYGLAIVKAAKNITEKSWLVSMKTLSISSTWCSVKISFLDHDSKKITHGLKDN